MAEIQRSGRYKGKTRNLTKKQVASGRRVGKAGRATVGKKEAKRAMKAIDIRETTWKKASERTGPRAKGGIVVDKNGKPITGTVTLASGKTATYVRGKRVAAQKPKPKAVSSRGGATSRGAGSSTVTQAMADRARQQQIEAFHRGVRKPNQAAGTRTGGSAGPSAQQVAAQARQRRAQRRRVQQGPNAMYSAAGTRVSMGSAKPPKRGDKRTIIRNGNRIGQRYDGTKWVDSA